MENPSFLSKTYVPETVTSAQYLSSIEIKRTTIFVFPTALANPAHVFLNLLIGLFKMLIKKTVSSIFATGLFSQ